MCIKFSAYCLGEDCFGEMFTLSEENFGRKFLDYLGALIFEESFFKNTESEYSIIPNT